MSIPVQFHQTCSVQKDAKNEMLLLKAGGGKLECFLEVISVWFWEYTDAMHQSNNYTCILAI